MIEMKKGFTLIELIAVIAIIGILTVLVVLNVIKIFKSSNDNTMNTQKNNLVDSAKIMIEDYCINPLGSTERSQCENYFVDSGNNYRYLCYDALIDKKYLDNDYSLEYSGATCNAMIIFTDKMGEGYRYNTVKSYVKCAEAYDDATAVKSDYEAAYNACIGG